MHLKELLEFVYRGHQPLFLEEDKLKKVVRDMVIPDNFYRTTNNPTQIYFKGSWINVENMMMDKCILVSTKSNDRRM